MSAQQLAAIDCRTVTAGDWPLIEALFGPLGACGGCWCMHWFAPPGEAAWEAMKGAANQRALRGQVEWGECFAALAIDGDQPVGWCRAGPTAGFPRLLRSRKLVRPAMADWAIVCLFVARSNRRRGLSSRLLSAAVRMAKTHGARSIEGYPLVRTGAEIPAAFAWTGFEGAFAEAGFRPLPHDAGSRRIYRKEIVP